MTPNSNISELLGKSFQAESKSKRTTFKLSQESYDALDWIMDSFDYTSKEVFDKMTDIDDLFTSVTMSNEITKSSNSAKRKSFVLSQSSLTFINKKAETIDITRDQLIDHCLQNFKRMLEIILIKEQESEEKALDLIDDIRSQLYDAERKIKSLLHKDNPIISRIGTLVIIADNLQMAVYDKVNNGEPVDPEVL